MNAKLIGCILMGVFVAHLAVFMMIDRYRWMNRPAPAPTPDAAPPVENQTDVPLEKADTGTPSGNAPRLVVRGFVMMGGLVIKS